MMVLPFGEDGGRQLVEHIPNLRSLDELVLTADTRRVLDRAILENQNALALRAKHLAPATRFLFCGPSGCGKTASAGAVARELGRPLFRMSLDSVVASYMGKTAANLRKVFDLAQGQQLVLLLDEFDALGRERSSNDRTDVAEMKRVVNSLLIMLEDLSGNSVVIAATNHQDSLDSALWRRFDDVVEFPRPTPLQSADLMFRLLARYELSPSGTSRTWSRRLTGLSFADVERIALHAAKSVTLADGHMTIGHALASAIVRQRERLSISNHRRA
jgi:SpoVK/Ycf46/Vps4 family AAA+-type ATPase